MVWPHQMSAGSTLSHSVSSISASSTAEFSLSVILLAGGGGERRCMLLCRAHCILRRVQDLQLTLVRA